jgi:hypothetical protein
VVLPSLDGTLGGVSAVDIGWHELEIYRVFGEGLFHNVGAFVVQDVESWGKTVVSKLVV